MTNANDTSSTKPSRKRTPKKVKEDMLNIDPDNPNQQDFILGGDTIHIKTSTIVKLHERIVVQYDNGPIELIVEITADFDEIPKRYHEIF